MDYQFTLRRFFVLVFLFVICPIVAWVAYAHRTNAPANAFLAGEKDSIYSENVDIPEQNLDMTTPFYQNEAGEKVAKDMGRRTSTDLWEEKEGAESKVIKPTDPKADDPKKNADTTKTPIK